MQTTETELLKDKRSLMTLIAAFAAVYIIWGSTYLGIKYAIETLPSFLMAGVRFTVAGAVLFAWARFSGNYEKTKLVHWRTSLIVGTLLLGVGNGGVVFAEHYISSSLTALLVATTPFWIVLLGWMFMGNGRPNSKVILGLAVGFIGVALLILGRTADSGTTSNGQIIGIISILIATLAWAGGSLYGTKAATVESAAQAAGMQMLAGGAVLLTFGTIVGEWSSFDPAAVSSVSLLALGYLIVFGAIIAYTAYSWLMKNASPATVSTYAYVNPAIAVFLGWAIAGETLTGQMLVGAVIVVMSIALITIHKKAKSDVKDEADIHSSNTPTPRQKSLSASA